VGGCGIKKHLTLKPPYRSSTPCAMQAALWRTHNQRFSNQQCKQALFFHSHRKLIAPCNEKELVFETDTHTHTHTYTYTQRVFSGNRRIRAGYATLVSMSALECDVYVLRFLPGSSLRVLNVFCRAEYLFVVQKYASLNTVSLKVMRTQCL
jgi:hypothetical protein